MPFSTKPPKKKMEKGGKKSRSRRSVELTHHTHLAPNLPTRTTRCGTAGTVWVGPSEARWAKVDAEVIVLDVVDRDLRVGGAVGGVAKAGRELGGHEYAGPRPA